MDIEPLKDAYWAIVADCLERFHDYSAGDAREAARTLRRAIEFPRPRDVPPGYDSDLFFHNEPFHVACDIAGRELVPEAVEAEYDALVRSRYGPAEERLRSMGALHPGACNAH